MQSTGVRVNIFLKLLEAGTVTGTSVLMGFLGDLPSLVGTSYAVTYVDGSTSTIVPSIGFILPLFNFTAQTTTQISQTVGMPSPAFLSFYDWLLVAAPGAVKAAASDSSTPTSTPGATAAASSDAAGSRRSLLQQGSSNVILDVSNKPVGTFGVFPDGAGGKVAVWKLNSFAVGQAVADGRCFVWHECVGNGVP